MINDPQAKEGTAAGNVAEFIVRLNLPSSHVVTIDFATADGTAKAGTDYISKTGTVTFQPGESTLVVGVQLVADSVIESLENFSMHLSNPMNGKLIDNQGLGSIQDDDTPIDPEIDVSFPRIAEGNSGTRDLVFVLSLNTPVLDKTVSVSVKTVTVSGTSGNATPGVDYQARENVVAFTPGTLTKEFRVPIIGDTTVEGAEAVYVTLSGANIDLARTNTVGLILNDDLL